MSVPYTAIVRFPYEPDQENAADDLPLAMDEKITVTEIVDDDWLFGSNMEGTRSGYFPRTFVEKLEAPVEEEKSNYEVSKEPPTEQESTESLNGAETQEEVRQNTSEPSERLREIEANIVHEPENFKNKLQTFNTATVPVIPSQKLHDDYAVKKQFPVTEHHSSYIPPSFGDSKPIKKDEKIPDVVSGEVVKSSSVTEAIEEPRMTLKERLQLLQKQQEEERKALEAALKRKEEKKRARHNVEPSPAEVHSEAEEVDVGAAHDENEDGVSLRTTKSPDRRSSIMTAKEGEVLQDEGNALDETEEGDSNESEEDDLEDTEEEDEEELRKRRLAERMAKLSGGMGMMGMMGMPMMPPSAKAKKSSQHKKEKAIVSEEEVPAPVPILPVVPGGAPPIMGMPMPNSQTESHAPKSDTSEENHEENMHTNDILSSPTESAEQEDKPLREKIELTKSRIGSIKSSKTNGSVTAGSSDDNGSEFEDTVEHRDQPPAPPATVHPYRPSFVSASPSPVISNSLPEKREVLPTTSTKDAPPPVPSSPPPISQHGQEELETGATTVPHIPVPSVPVTHAPPVPISAIATATPTAVPVMTHAPPPPPAVSQRPPPPPVPSSVPQEIPATVPPAERPPILPPLCTTDLGSPPSVTMSSPPPIPGAVPNVASPTQTRGAPPPMPPQIPAPTPGHLTRADAISRHSSVSSRPPIPPVPPTSAAPPIPKSASSVFSESSTRKHSTLHSHPEPTPGSEPPCQSIETAPPAPFIQRQATRTSLESSASTPCIAPHIESNNTELWWTTESLPPQLNALETYFEVEATEIPKRGGRLTKYLVYYILDAQLGCTTLELAYDVSEPERIMFFHESKHKVKADRKKLIEEYTKYGPLAYNIAVGSLKKSFSGEYVDYIFSQLPDSVLLPIANKTYGAVVYRNNNGDTKFYDDIRPGDVLVVVNATFEGSTTKHVGVLKPQVSIVTSFDAEKNKIKVIEQSEGMVQQARYKLKNLASGKLRVFRIVGRDYIGW